MKAKVIVLYVTRTGHAKTVAEALASKLGAEAVEIKDLVDRRGILGYIKTGYQASTKKATPIEAPAVDLASASTVVLVQPIWASAVVPPFRTWLDAHGAELKGKRVGLFVVCKGSDPTAVRRAYEGEFGPLTAFDGVRERDEEMLRNSVYDAFVDTLLARTV